MTVESEFTPPSAHCPHPEWWHADNSEATELEVVEFVGALVRVLQPELVVETGVWEAHSTVAIGEALVRNGHGHLHAVEIDGGLAGAARVKVAGLPVTVWEGSSLEWTPPGPIDFGWLDSSVFTRHEEIRRFWPWVHGRTVLAVHDTGPQHPVRRFLGSVEDGMVVLDLPTPRGVSLLRRR